MTAKSPESSSRKSGQTLPPEEYAAKRRYFASNAIRGYPFVHPPARVAREPPIAGLGLLRAGHGFAGGEDSHAA